MITDGKKRHYLTVKRVSALSHGINSRNNGDYCCIYYLNLFRTKNKLKLHQNLCKKNHDCCYIEMPEKIMNIIKYNTGKNSLKVTSVIYADTESVIGKIDTS